MTGIVKEPDLLRNGVLLLPRDLEIVQAIEEVVSQTDLFHGNVQGVERVRRIRGVAIYAFTTDPDAVAPYGAVRDGGERGGGRDPEGSHGLERVDVREFGDDVPEGDREGLEEVGQVHDGDGREHDHEEERP